MNELPERTPWVGTGGGNMATAAVWMVHSGAWRDPPAPAEGRYAPKTTETTARLRGWGLAGVGREGAVGQRRDVLRLRAGRPCSGPPGPRRRRWSPSPGQIDSAVQGVAVLRQSCVARAPASLSRRCTSSSISCWVASEYCRLRLSWSPRCKEGRRRRSRRDRAADSCRTPAPCGRRAEVGPPPEIVGRPPLETSRG